MSKFDPLKDMLAACEEESLTLSFDKIEKIMRRPLCNSAFIYAEYWSVADGHILPNTIKSAGYKITSVDLKNKRISLKKIRKTTEKPMKKIRMGVIGLGNRGHGVMNNVILNLKDVEVTAVCDEYEDRCERAIGTVKEKSGKEPFSTTDYRELLKSGLVDAVYVATSWEMHIKISIDAMRAGVAVAMEVGGAYDISECYDLVNTYEQTHTPIMLMENCCFDKNELLATSMVRKGKLGTVVHCAGAYAHDLRSEIAGGNVNRHYRLRNYLTRNCENYPTHELGPIAKLLNINRGNRMVSLVSVASKSAGMHDYLAAKEDADKTIADKNFAQGDIVTTIITCAGGETILLRLDTTLPRFYNREFTVRGTKGLYEQGNNVFFLDGMPEAGVPDFYKENYSNADKYTDEFMPSIWKDITEEQKQTGHGGMDGFEFLAFTDALKNGKEMPIDVYDAAAWMCISALSERSIAQGGAPQSIPDFTNGKWVIREPKDVVEL